MVVMAPLLIASPEGWEKFRQDLRIVKSRGFSSVSVDVWWGLVEALEPGIYDWTYYDQISKVIHEEGLEWMPILSTHACGGNVGDDVSIPVPEWIWSKAANLSYVSEAGALNRDCVAHFADDVVIDDYRRFWSAFKERYTLRASKDLAPINEIELSLGPSGELHYPAYHGHDADHPKSSYPHRGVFQGCGPRANAEFAIWKHKQDPGSPALPPIEELIENLYSRLAAGEYFTPGPLCDVFSWYHDSLVDHLERIVRAAAETFGTSVPLAVKIPGVHWHEARLAELMNGLVDPRSFMSSWYSIEEGLGYAKIFERLRSLKGEIPGLNLRVYITAAATADSLLPFSRGETLVRAFGHLSRSFGIPLGLENALAGDVYSEAALDVLESHLREGPADSVTLLRLEDVARSQALSAARCTRLIRG